MRRTATASSCARWAPARSPPHCCCSRTSALALVTVLLTAFGRAISEVGAVMIVGGNIDGVTRVMTTAIALETSKGDLPLALGLGIVLLGTVGVVNVGIALLQRVQHSTTRGIDELDAGAAHGPPRRAAPARPDPLEGRRCTGRTGCSIAAADRAAQRRRALRRRRPRSTASTSRCAPASASRWSAATAPARPRCCACCTASCRARASGASRAMPSAASRRRPWCSSGRSCCACRYGTTCCSRCGWPACRARSACSVPNEALARVGLEDQRQRPARVLSGGQQQRLALARAWAVRPERAVPRRADRQPRPACQARGRSARRRRSPTKA